MQAMLSPYFLTDKNKQENMNKTPSEHVDSSDDANYFATQGLHERDS